MSDKESLWDIAEKAENLTIYDTFFKANPKILLHNNIVCSISGGSDSDIILDILTKLDDEKKIHYVFFDTGIEYAATKEHLDFLESKYGIKIERMKALVPVPLGTRKFGQPFFSKWVSEMIERLQKVNFKWEDKPYEELIKEYPKCSSALKWWCNKWGDDDSNKQSRFDISHITLLKEFMIENPPTFKISSKCCNGAKKNNAKVYIKTHNADLNIFGVRKSEGGIRSQAYKSCFSEGKNGNADTYLPIFWFSDEDKKRYEETFGVTHSRCYTEYGFKRTGCAGCPFNKQFETDLSIIFAKEPKLYGAVNKIFKESYEYTRKFYEFREMRKYGSVQGKMILF